MMFCLARVSLEPRGLFTFTRFGLASVDAIKKNSSKMNKMSFSGPVWTSECALSFRRMFIRSQDSKVKNKTLSRRFLQHINKLGTRCFHAVGRFIYQRSQIVMGDIRQQTNNQTRCRGYH